MEQIITLFVIELILIVLIYTLSNGNLLSPSFITYVMFAIATVCVLYNVDFWDVSYSWNTVFILFFGFLSMLIPEIFYIFATKQYITHKSSTYKDYQVIHVKTLVNWMILVLCAFFLLVQISRTFSLGNFAQYGLYSIGLVKHSEESFDSITKISLRIIQVFGTIYMYIVLNNVVRCKVKLKNELSHILPIICYCTSIFFSGNRLGFVKVLASFYVFFVVMNHDLSPIGKVKLKKIIIPAAILGTLVIVGFFSLRGFSKVNSTSATRNFVDYITYYLGSPLYLFDKYVNNPAMVHGENKLFGQMSLTSIYTTLGIDVNNANNVTLVGGDAYFAGNEYSWFQRPMADFGVLGMLIFTTFIYWIFNYLIYKKIYKIRNTRKRNKYIIIYAFFFYIPMMAFYYCQVCNAFSIFTILMLVSIIWGVNNLSRVSIKGKS